MFNIFLGLCIYFVQKSVKVILENHWLKSFWIAYYMLSHLLYITFLFILWPDFSLKWLILVCLLLFTQSKLYKTIMYVRESHCNFVSFFITSLINFLNKFSDPKDPMDKSRFIWSCSHDSDLLYILVIESNVSFLILSSFGHLSESEAHFQLLFDFKIYRFIVLPLSYHFPAKITFVKKYNFCYSFSNFKT